MSDPNTLNILKSLETAYLEGKYQQGIDLLLENKKEFDTGLFHYNLGTFYAKLGNLPVARFHFEKAILNGQTGADARKNLMSTKQKLGMVKQESSLGIPDKILFEGASLPGDAFMVISLGLILLTSFLAIFGMVRSKWLLALMLLCSMGPLATHYLYFNKMGLAVNFENSEIFEGPSKIFSVSERLPAGSKVIIEKVQDGWSYISAPTSFTGWIEQKDIGRLK